MNTSSTLKKSIITVISATFARCAVFAPLSVYLSYLYTYIESVTLGIFMTVCRVIADFLVCLSVYAMLGGIYTLVRAHKIKGASLCAASYILSLAAGALISYFIELLLVKAGMTDYTEAMFAEETGDIFLTAVISLLSALFLLFFTFVFSFALRPVYHVRRQNTRATKKSDSLATIAQCWRYLSSRAVTSQVLWAETSLTTVFGMGTGGPSS